MRYCHVLNPKTGWSVPDTPHTVSVVAPSCVEAGMMSTLVMLQGGKARGFLGGLGFGCQISIVIPAEAGIHVWAYMKLLNLRSNL